MEIINERPPLPYLAACILVLATRTSAGRWYWLELGLIFGGAFIFRAMLLPLPPVLSHDSWRYVWDARVLLHGYSPYVTVPNSLVLVPLRDQQIYWHMAYREVPTLYPPWRTVHLYLELPACSQQPHVSQSPLPAL